MGSNLETLTLDGGPLTTGQVELVARGGIPVTLAPSALGKLAASHTRLVAAMSDGGLHYGVNTGFGGLSNVAIDAESLRQLQANLIRSHSTGVGPPLSVEIVRATMVTLCASLCRGHSGVRPDVVQLLAEMLNHHISPEVPETGSVGASGDLAPLAHIGLVMLGEGTARRKVGARFENGEHFTCEAAIPGREALASVGLRPLQLEAKEGLALINGTHLMTGWAALIAEQFDRIFDAALVAAAMSFDACRATNATLDDRLHQVRCQSGQIRVAQRLRSLLAESQIVESHRVNDPRTQDPYSFRCCPAVLGAAWDAFCYVRSQIENELGAVTDNPLILGNEKTASIVSGGNFHGMPIALPLDVLSMAASHVAGIAERRVFHMLSGHDPQAELPTFLAPQAGLQSGLMITQYTAAACCNELIGLANPASVANLSTSAGMEDYNSFGPRCAAKAARAMQLTRSVVAIEILCAATGLDYHRPLRSGPAVERAFEQVRAAVPPQQEDRPPAPDIQAIEEMIDSGVFRESL